MRAFRKSPDWGRRGLIALQALIGLFVLPAAPGAAAAKGTAWGQERDGFQVGLGFTGEKRAYRFGETVAFTITIRNVGKEPATLALKAPSLWLAGLAPGGDIALNVLPGDPAPFTLAPGEERAVPGPAPTFVLQPTGDFPKTDTPALPLAPGHYKVRAPLTLWIADKGDASSATGLRAQPGTLDLEVVGDKGTGNGAKPAALATVWEGGKARKAGTIPPSWGEAVNGLQAGVAFHDPAACCPVFGETVALDLYVRNVSGKPLTVTYSRFQPYDFSPIVKNAAGESIRVRTTFVSGMRGQAAQTLKPGEAVVIGHPAFRIEREQGPSGGFDTLVDAAPGKYTLSLYAQSRFAGADRFDMVIPTGALDLIVEEKK